MGFSTAKSGDTVTAFQAPGVSGKGQLVGFVQTKDLYTPITRAGIVGADVGAGVFDPAALTPFDVGVASYLWIGGFCSEPDRTIDFVLGLWQTGADNTDVFMGVSQGLGLQSSPTYKTGSNYWQEGVPVLFDLAGVSKAAFIVTAVSGGSWTLRAKPF